MTFGKKMAFSGAKAALTTGVILGFAGLSTGCDTVARISFQERTISRIEVMGMTPEAGSCDGSEAGADMRFVMIADDSTPIRPGDVLDNIPVDLTRDSVALENGRLYELPDVACDESSCVFPDDGFTCSAGVSVEEASLRRCNRELGLSVGEVSFEADTEKPQLFAMLVENSGSLAGWLPSDLAGYYPDWDNDGTAEGTTDTNRVAGRASDSSKSRAVAFSQVATTWRSATALALNEGRRTVFGLWQFSGTSTADVRSLVAEVSTSESPWADQATTAIAAVGQLEDPGQRRGNVFQAMSTVFEEALIDPEFEGYEKTVVVFVDGPDELRLNAFDEARVIEAANAVDARVFIVHLDSDVAQEDLSGNPYFRDDPSYYEDQEPCESDATCENFEECRTPVRYSTTPGGAVEIGGTDTFCLPQRDENGRIGPIHAYQRIACETDGSYIYVPSATALRSRMQYLPHVMDGLWKVNTTLDAFENRRVAPDEPYKVQASFRVNVGTREPIFVLSQVGDPNAGTQTEDQDTRAVLFHK